MADFLTDTFTEPTADTALQSHTPEVGGSWVETTGSTVDAIVRATGNTGAGTVDNNTGASGSWYHNDAAPPSADYAVEGVFEHFSTATGFAYFLIRAKSSARDAYRLGYNASALTWELDKVIGAIRSGANHTHTVAAWTGTKTVRVEVSGTGATVSLRVFIDDVEDTALAWDDTEADRIVAANFAGLLVPSGAAAGVSKRLSSIRAFTAGPSQSQAPRSISQNRFMRG